MRRWLANPNDGAAADQVEANPLEVGLTRTRCIATMLQARPCRQRLAAERAGDGQLPDFPGRPAEGRPGRAPAARRAQGHGHAGSQLHRRADPAVAASARRAQGGHQGDPGNPRPADARHPDHVDRSSDGSFFRAQGIPVYDVDGSWGISPDDERAHGLDERLPVRAMYDDVVHWESLFRDLAGK